MLQIRDFLATHSGWLWWLGAVVAAALIGIAGHRAIFIVIRQIQPRRLQTLRRILLARTEGPTKVILPAFLVSIVIPLLPLSSTPLAGLQHLAGLVVIGIMGWLILMAVLVLEDLVAARYNIADRDNLRARQIRTQTQMLRRISEVIIVVFTVGFMLMTFPQIRRLGLSLFASAGIAGLVVGMAARPALTNIIAGLQIALTEPIRLDDVVIVENEWGWIEEIGTTFVVVRIWDLRRLVVPLSYFIQTPFQNWTRTSADLLGTVFLYTDYTLPVDAVRDALTRILASTELWDGKVNVLQVTDATAQTMQLRALMSAADSSKLWDLRCFVREKLIAFLQQEHPESLPKTRAELNPPIEVRAETAPRIMRS